MCCELSHSAKRGRVADVARKGMFGGKKARSFSNKAYTLRKLPPHCETQCASSIITAQINYPLPESYGTRHALDTSSPATSEYLGRDLPQVPGMLVRCYIQVVILFVPFVIQNPMCHH